MKAAAVFLTLLLCGCVSAEKRVWDPAVAAADAERDLAGKRVVIFYSGTVAAYPVGVPASLIDLVAGARKGDAGVGCIVEDVVLRGKQADYATIYNRTVIRHLLRRAGRPAEILDQEIAREAREGAHQPADRTPGTGAPGESDRP